MNFPLKLMFIFLQVCEIVLSQSYTQATYRNVKIGGIFPENSDLLINAFKNATQYFNRNDGDKVILQATAITVDTSDSYRVQKAVCDMISNNNDDNGNNLIAIFGPNSPETVGLVASICKKLQLPHFVAIWRPNDVDFNANDSFTRNIFPQPQQYSRALYKIIKSFQWKKFAMIYDSDDALVRFQEIFPISYDTDFTGRSQIQSMRFHRLPDTVDGYLVMLKNLTKSGISSVILDLSLKNTEALLSQTHRVSMNNEYYQYFIANNDGYTIDYRSLVNFDANITTIRLFNPDLIYDYEYSFSSMKFPNYMLTEAAMIKDAVAVFAKALIYNDTRALTESEVNPIDCYSFDPEQEPNSIGRDILDNLNETTPYQGLTEQIYFDNDGQRSSFYVEVLELQRRRGKDDSTIYEYSTIAKYRSTSKDNNKDEIEYMKNFTTAEEEISANMQGKRFKVIMRIGEPFLRKKAEFIANDTIGDPFDIKKYEGFSKDLFEKIAEICKFEYETIVYENTYPYGKENIKTKEWNGIVGEIVKKNADFAIGDITITQSRKSAIDFSISFQTLGVSILYGKPNKTPPGLFSFMAPLSAHVWLHMATAFLIISIVEWLLAKIADLDWENPHPCDENPEELENIWDMHNCIWLSVGSIMQQGCDILPKGIPPRLAAVAWWFFALIVISSYTANLAAFLTNEKIEMSIKGIDDLASQKEIRYGLVTGGATESLFKNSNFTTYQKMWNFMEKAEPSVFVENNDEGLDMVKRHSRKYAFFAETTVIEYYTYRDCNVTQIGGKLDSKEYGIGMPMNSPYRLHLNKAILHLQEEGILKELHKTWWEDKNLDENGNEPQCNTDEKEKADTPELGMDNVGGVFLVLGVGIAFSLLLGFLEFLWAVRQTSIEYKITPYEAFRKELSFDISVWELRKPIAPSSEQNSLQSSASDDEKAEEINLNSISIGKQNGSNSFKD